NRTPTPHRAAQLAMKIPGGSSVALSSERNGMAQEALIGCRVKIGSSEQYPARNPAYSIRSTLSLQLRPKCGGRLFKRDQAVVPQLPNRPRIKARGPYRRPVPA